MKAGKATLEVGDEAVKVDPVRSIEAQFDGEIRRCDLEGLRGAIFDS